MINPGMVRRLSLAKRDLLIEHIDTAVLVHHKHASRTIVAKSLMRDGLIRADMAGARPSATVLTPAGREAVAMILADYADAMVRAGLMEERPLQILQALRALRVNYRAIPGHPRPPKPS
jgi:hypothetical protein